MKRNSLILLLAAFLTACVTINIYFPAAAAQEVADEIIDDVWQLKQGEAEDDAAAQENTNAETPAEK